MIAVVSYPHLDAADRDWIESVRRLHDPQARLIDAHFTLVFPVEIEPATVRREIAALATVTPSIAFTIQRARAVPDRGTGGGHVFLVPEEGRPDIDSLHDRLYHGAFAPSLRTDLPYIPHLTVAANPDMARCEELVDEMNRSLRVVRGSVTRVDLIEVRTPRVETVASFALQDR